MLKVGDQVTLTVKEQELKAIVRNGPYRKEFQALYTNNTPTTFVDDVYDLIANEEEIEGIRRKYLKKIH